MKCVPTGLSVDVSKNAYRLDWSSVLFLFILQLTHSFTLLEGSL